MKVGDKVEVILSKDWVMILDIIDDNIFQCRTKSNDIIEFYKFELKEIE